MRVATPEQEAAIAAAGADVLLEAGAGTGKTGVMVERYCRLACEDEIDPDAILAFTFTDKAATELRQRVRDELSRRAAAGSERAGRLLGEIGGAWITTIHGFCSRLLAGHPVAAGIDPGFRVLDPHEAERAEREAFEQAVDLFLAAHGDPAEGLIACYGLDGLRAVVAGLHAELRSRGVAAPARPAQAPPDVEGALRDAAAAATAALEELKPDDPKRELLLRAAERLAATAPPPVDEICALRSGSKAKPLTAYNDALEAAIARTAEAGEGGEAYRLLSALLELFSARFAAAKERRAGVDFEDLQILAVSLLERTEIGEAYRLRFSHLMVDEFQDTNRLQLRLVKALQEPDCELIAVGDELQSIYGFRHADLDVFREQRRAVDESPRGQRMELSGNFRSRPEVIGAVNAIGAALLGDSYRDLRAGAAEEVEGTAGSAAAVELLLTARDGWDGEDIDLAPATDDRTPASSLAEARFVAERLRALADEGVDLGEMVVLLRAFTHLDAYEGSLARAGLRPYVVGGRGYWSQQQVADVCALLAAIANPLDDLALFGALASPACGVAPDTLWLLRMAAGARRHVWPAVRQAAGGDEEELAEPERLAQIPEAELALLRRFATAVRDLRARRHRLTLAGLIDAAVRETGYDLAVLMRPSGEARFANVRKLLGLAEEFEAHEGRDLRGLLDFLAVRAEAGAEAQAATAVEGHDGVRIMTVHNAKGLEFGVVAVPDLARSLLAGTRPPLLALGREPEPRVGMQMRRLGAGSINLYAYADLCEEAKRRDAEEGLRLFHVAATRARRRLILSGVVKPQPNGEEKPSTPVIERIAAAFDLDRERDSTVAVPAPEPRPGLDLDLTASEIAVRVSLPSPERAEELKRRHREDVAAPAAVAGPAPLLRQPVPAVPQRPLSYSAIAAFEECPHRFYLERVLGLQAERDEGAARGTVVHALLEWSHANRWSEPPGELVERHALSAGLPHADVGSLSETVRGWLGSGLLAERVRDAGATVRAEEPFLLGTGGTVLRGSIDLLVERDGAPPLVVDYKTDRLGDSTPAEKASRYATQRDIYALAVAESRGVPEVEVAYVFLERPDEPVRALLTRDEVESARQRVAWAVERIATSDFPAADADRRDWGLCRGCPALGRTCRGPAEA